MRQNRGVTDGDREKANVTYANGVSVDIDALQARFERAWDGSGKPGYDRVLQRSFTWVTAHHLVGQVPRGLRQPLVGSGPSCAVRVDRVRRNVSDKIEHALGSGNVRVPDTSRDRIGRQSRQVTEKEVQAGRRREVEVKPARCGGHSPILSESGRQAVG